MELKANHKALVIRVPEPRVHTNADTLELIDIPGTLYQCVVKKGQYKSGDLAVYIQPDSVVPQTEPFRFIWEPYVDPVNPQECSERRRRITVRKFRKEISEGLLLPLTDFSAIAIDEVREGDDLAVLIGITHYDPDKGKEATTGENERGPSTVRKYPRSLKGWFYFLLHKIGINLNGSTQGWDREGSPFHVPVYDVDALKNYAGVFEPGEEVAMTEKIHGSNARYVYHGDKQYVGSRTLWKSPQSQCVWRKALAQDERIGNWCQAHPSHVLYGEVTPTQGDTFMYGCKDDEVRFFLFDVRLPDGTFVKPWNLPLEMVEGLPMQVPMLYRGPFDANALKALAEGNSLVPGAKHVREGGVISPVVEREARGLGRVQLKIVSNAFYEIDAKDSKRRGQLIGNKHNVPAERPILPGADAR